MVRGTYDDQKVRKCDDGVRRRPGDTHDDVRVATNTTRDICVEPAEHSSYDQMAYTHRNGSPNQKCSPADLVDEEEHDGREDDEQSVLHTRGNKLGVAFKASHGEDVYDVVSHDLRVISKTKLREVNITYVGT